MTSSSVIAAFLYQTSKALQIETKCGDLRGAPRIGLRRANLRAE
jgi:hypothetical protein